MKYFVIGQRRGEAHIRVVANTASRRKPCPMMYIYSAKTLRAMLADAKLALKLVEDSEALNVQDMIDAIISELSTRKD